ncbi:MAG: response regulator transcription factor [Clostridiales bacterium]|nr:response regulator transcription factor [Clostridiales bacterium]
MMNKILIAEDELAINKMICMNLNITGYETVSFQDGQEVLDYLSQGGVADLAIVDVMMPKVDGFALLEPLKMKGIPVIYLTARGDLESKLKGLAGGAEDYMVKPFEMLELLVRIDMILKRTGKSQEILSLDDITLDMKKRIVKKKEETILLTPMEYDLLCLLGKNRNIAMNRDKLLSEIWGIDFEGETRTVDVHVAALRRKTGLHIVSVPKIGYRLEVDEK